MTRKKGIQCKICGDKIFSFHRHDFKSCSCGNCFVDGGDDYFRTGMKQENSVKIIIKKGEQRCLKDQSVGSWRIAKKLSQNWDEIAWPSKQKKKGSKNDKKQK